MRILCVDDDATFVVMYRKVLEKHCRPDDEVLVAESGENGVAIMREKPVDVVITDLVMPGMSGMEVLRLAKEIRPATEVVVVTGRGSIDSAVEAMRLGARDYLTKPVNHGLLVEKIGTIREFIGRGAEAENYRFAKEVIESSAQRTVGDLEYRLGRYMAAVEDVRSVIAGDKSDAGKVALILERLDAVDER